MDAPPEDSARPAGTSGGGSRRQAPSEAWEALSDDEYGEPAKPWHRGSAPFAPTAQKREAGQKVADRLLTMLRAEGDTPDAARPRIEPHLDDQTTREEPPIPPCFTRSAPPEPW